MITTIIIYVIIAAIAGAIISYLIVRNVITKKSALTDSRTKENDIVPVQLADVDKLKKQIQNLQNEIKNLQDENEEYEDDIDEQKKKLKNKENEYDELHSQLDKEKRENKEHLQKLEQIKSELEEKLKLKSDSLSFIQEILTAKQAQDDQTKELYLNVKKVSDFVKGDLKDCITKNSLNLDKKFFDEDLEKWAAAAKKSWIKNKTTIAFVGEFSAGKTAIVNRILSQDDPNVPQLPESAKATTAIPTYISNGINAAYRFVSPDNILKGISENTFKSISKETLEQAGDVSSLIKYFVMTYKNTHLEKLSILDTPGFISNDPKDAERTIGVINECDALFWVFDTNVGTVNGTSIKTIKKNFKKPLYVVINKIDTKAKSEVDKVEQLVRKTLNDEKIEVKQIIRFSKKENLSVIMNPIKSVTHDAARDTYIEDISTKINEFVTALDTEVTNASEIWQEKNRTSNNLTEQFNREMRSLREKCEDAAGIPEWKEPWFRKNHYEMTGGEGDRLINLLNTISSQQVSEIQTTFNKRINSEKETEKAYTDYRDKKEKHQKMLDCSEQFKRLIKSLK